MTLFALRQSQDQQPDREENLYRDALSIKRRFYYYSGLVFWAAPRYFVSALFEKRLQYIKIYIIIINVSIYIKIKCVYISSSVQFCIGSIIKLIAFASLNSLNSCMTYTRFILIILNIILYYKKI